MEEKRFVLEYEFDNKKWGEELHAKDWDEAKRKLQALKETIVLLGRFISWRQLKEALQLDGMEKATDIIARMLILQRRNSPCPFNDLRAYPPKLKE